MKNALLCLFAIAGVLTAHAQATRADIFNSDKPITWLGIDFTQLKFIGNAAQYKDAGEITNNDMKDKYFRAWNDIVTNEQTKYNVAEAVHRSNVVYAIDVAETANGNGKGDGYFSNDPADYHLLDEQKLNGLVKHYNFKQKTGIGLMLLIDGMDKANAKASVWIVFVDISNKVVLLSKHMDEKGGGFGFRNYWAKAIHNTLDDIKNNYGDWKK